MTEERTVDMNMIYHIFHKHFRFVSMKNIKSSVWAPDKDPGQWSPKSLLVVHLESGLPDVFTYPDSFNKWAKVEQDLEAVFGQHVYFESINCAVTALWAV